LPPTATPVPGPRIINLAATGEGLRRDINEQGLDVFFVNGGSEVTILWEAEGATDVRILDVPDAAAERLYDKRLPKDQFTLVADGSRRIDMTAFNNPNGADVNGDKALFGQATRSIRIELNPPVEYDPPTNVAYSGGASDEDPVVITWEYNPDQADDIEGFRIYKAPAGSVSYVRIVDESELDNTARGHTDEAAPLCGQSYYIVAVYLDLTRPGADKTVETDAGDASFFTPPCQ
jgi:hypothetical protein